MAQIADYETYKRIKLLGEGAFGKAFLAECISDGALCVIKQVDLSKMNDQEKKDTMKEARVLESFNHPNIVRFKEVYKTKKGRLCIVMDYADGGDLAGRIKDQKGQSFPENQILDWFTQICLALKHVHDRKIIHRDLKGQNIFLTKANIIKLGDFGIARVLSNTKENAKTMVGTPYYLSPEIINGKPYSFKSDIWSLGVVLYEMCALKPPFDAQSITFLAMKIVKGQYSPVPHQFSKELKNLVGNLLQVDSLRRPSVNEVLKFPLIQNRIQNFLSKSIKIQEFSHTILHKQVICINLGLENNYTYINNISTLQNFVKNDIKFENIKSVNNEAPMPAHLVKAHQDKEREKNMYNPKPPLPNNLNIQPQARPSPNIMNNIIPPSAKEEKPEIAQKVNPSANRPIYNPAPQNSSPGKQNLYNRNSPNIEPVQEPYRGPRIVDGSKPADQKNGIQRKNNIEEKGSNWIKHIQATPKERQVAQPEKRNSYLTPQPSNKLVNKATPESSVKQQIQQNQYNRIEAAKRGNERDILGGGGGGMAFNFAPSSNKNAKDSGKKRELFTAAPKKKPTTQNPVKKVEPSQRDKDAAQQKIIDMKRKYEEDRIKREKKLLEEAEKKQNAEEQKLERKREEEERRKNMRQDMQNRRNAAKKEKASGVQFEVLDLHGNSLNELQDVEEGKEEEEEEELAVVDRREGTRIPKVKEVRSVQREEKKSDENSSARKGPSEEMLAAKNRKVTNVPKVDKKDLKRQFSKNSNQGEDKFSVEIFVPGKNAPVRFDGVEPEEETNAETNLITNNSENLLPDELKARESDSTPNAGTREEIDQKESGGSDLGTILGTATDLIGTEDEEDLGQEPFISKLEHDIETYDQNNFVDQQGIENLQNFNDLCDELSKAILPEDEAEIEKAIASDDDLDQEDDRDDDLSDSSLDDIQETPNPKQEADEETMEFLMDYSKLECLKMKLENILGTDVFYEAYRIFKDLLQTDTLDEIQEKYRKSDHYKSLFPFMSDEARERDLEFVFTYVVCEENAEKQGL